MNNKYFYLQDEAFLKIIDELPVKTHNVRLTVLTLQNKPIAQIEGMAIGGNISVNGSSTVRRAGSLSIIADKTNYKITDLKNIIYMNKKVIVEVGYENQTNLYQNYNTIWFPLGLFVMSRANIQKNNQGISISLTLKDQMSLLNGENGGTFETSITHSPMYVEQIDSNGAIVEEEYVSFYRLIYELITEWGNIPPEYVIIEDVPLKIKNIVRWIGKEGVYLNPIIAGGIVVGYELGQASDLDLSDLGEDEKKLYTFYSMGDSIGYTEVDYIYPTQSELTSNAGESITSVLDKIKNALGNYEYFFDVNGFFHFQKIKDYVDEGVAVMDLNKALQLTAKDYLTQKKKSVYDFDTAKIVTSYSNAPAWQNIKNDFVVWGKKGDSADAIRYHLIIDNAPNPTFEEGIKVWQYQDAFGVYRFAKSNNEAEEKIEYNIKKAQKDGLKEELMKDPVEFELAGLNDTTDWRIKAYFQSILDDTSYFYSKELIEEIPKLYNFKEGINPSFHLGITPTTATYWIDIINNNELEKFTVTNIGKRTKSINNDKINCLFEPYFPEVYFIEAGTQLTAQQRNEYKINKKPFYQMQADSYQNLAIGMVTNSAYENLRAQIHTLLSFNESVSLGVLPIYHLEPNTRITIEDEDTNIHGDYMIKSFSLPLTANGSMTLQCTKAVERI